MKVVHTMLVRTNGDKATYAAQIVVCRWRDKERRKWSGKSIKNTGAEFECSRPYGERQKTWDECDALSRSEAARLGLPAGPDVFPFSH